MQNSQCIVEGEEEPLTYPTSPLNVGVFEHMCQVTGGDGVSVAAVRVIPADSQAIMVQLTNPLSSPQCYTTMHQSLGVEYS